jgi:hypothetical protein
MGCKHPNPQKEYAGQRINDSFTSSIPVSEIKWLSEAAKGESLSAEKLAGDFDTFSLFAATPSHG